jgi:hypothetical protein
MRPTSGNMISDPNTQPLHEPWDQSISLIESHRLMLRTYVSYLRLFVLPSSGKIWFMFRAGVERGAIETGDFLEYAARYWSTHFQASEIIE